MTVPLEGDLSKPLQIVRESIRLRWKRRRLLWRCFRSRRQLVPVSLHVEEIRPTQILAFATVRDEMDRLPFFLEHYRRLGVDQFLVVDNGSSDGTEAFLAGQPDVSLWRTDESYRASRFGVDWVGWLLMRYGHGHWCLTVDADELLVYANWTERHLRSLADALEVGGYDAFGALMLDLYPKGKLTHAGHEPAGDPLKSLRYFDNGPWTATRKQPEWNLWLQGGVRHRAFFAESPEKAPTLNKIPFLRWNRRYAYRNSTHSLLPRRLNLAYDGPGDTRPNGVLLHTKFLPMIAERAIREKQRGEHFGMPGQYDAYYEALATAPDLWRTDSLELAGWEQLADLGLISRA